ncbi:MAG: hypothetical protein IMF07_09065 [Proteobacteria bacterium]|nr:hypothetical protein [Pseudomonadota bacterium]
MKFILKCYRGIALWFLFLFLFTYGNAFGQMITVKPGPLARFTVSAPTEAISGEDFFLQIKAHDQNGNLITNYSDIGKSIKLISSGTHPLMPNSLSAISFIGGIATVKALYKKAENIVITVKDFSEASVGKSSAIRVKPNSIHHFSINVPDLATAGAAFGVTATALDAYDNLVVDYDTLGKGVNVSSSGTSKISPSFITSTSFKSGVAEVSFLYNKAENITVNMSEKGRPDISISNRITIQPDRIDRFVVTTEGVAIAGKPFAVKIKAVDSNDNVISNYDVTGKNVMLAITGSGELSPNTVSASSFVDGLATIDIAYNKAESFSIHAYQEGESFDIKKRPSSQRIEERREPALAPPSSPLEDFSDLLIVE